MSVRLLFSAPLSTLVSGKPLNTKFFFNGCGFSQVPVFLICFFFFFFKWMGSKNPNIRFWLPHLPLLSFSLSVFLSLSLPSLSHVICIRSFLTCLAVNVSAHLCGARYAGVHFYGNKLPIAFGSCIHLNTFWGVMKNIWLQIKSLIKQTGPVNL